MIRAIIIDDEQHCVDTLAIKLQEYCPEIKLLHTCRSAKTGIEAIEKLAPDLVFLDIEMPVMNGFQMLEQFENISFAVIFTTSFDQYAIKAIRFSALDYLLKPIDPKELIAAVHKVQFQKQPPLQEQYNVLFNHTHHKAGTFNKIAIPTSQGFEFVNCSDIVFCEADDNYTHFQLKDKKKITATRTLKDVEEQLQDFPHFLRVHYSYIVNMNEVSRYIRGEGGYLVMSDGTSVNVSRRRKDELLKWL